MSDIVKELKVRYHIDQMMKIDKELFERILDTTGFAYHFNEIANIARDYTPKETDNETSHKS